MRVRFWGTRGSIATPGPGTNHFGGNTSCVELTTANGRTVRVALSPNPSHLEAVNPVVEGRTRAQQTDRTTPIATQDPATVVPVLLLALLMQRFIISGLTRGAVRG